VITAVCDSTHFSLRESTEKCVESHTAVITCGLWNRPAGRQQSENPRARAKINICSSRKILPRAETRTGATGLSLGEKLPQEKKMRTLAMILRAAEGLPVPPP